MSVDSINVIKRSEKRRQNRFIVVMVILTVLAALFCTLTMIYGNTIYSPQKVWEVLLGHEGGREAFTIKTLRLPRMISGLLAGFAFGFAGSIFQTMLRNPLANPNIIGITSASSVGAVFCILILHATGMTAFSGSIAAALVTAVLILLLSRRRRFSTGRLILVGIGFQAMMNSMISYLLLIGSENDIASAMRWMSGSLNGVQMSSIYPLMVVMIICIPLITYHLGSLKIMELGEESAISMGVRTDVTRAVLMIASVIMTAVATATTGPISFVAFLSGPIAKRIAGYGNSSPWAAGLFGAVLVLASDFIGQNIMATRFPVGVITGMLGAPYLVYLLIRMNKRGEF